jgi:hypothetical protein
VPLPTNPYALSWAAVRLHDHLAAVAGHAGVGDVVAGGRQAGLGGQQTAFADIEKISSHNVISFVLASYGRRRQT